LAQSVNDGNYLPLVRAHHTLLRNITFLHSQADFGPVCLDKTCAYSQFVQVEGCVIDFANLSCDTHGNNIFFAVTKQATGSHDCIYAGGTITKAFVELWH